MDGWPRIDGSTKDGNLALSVRKRTKWDIRVELRNCYIREKVPYCLDPSHYFPSSLFPRFFLPHTTCL